MQMPDMGHARQPRRDGTDPTSDGVRMNDVKTPGAEKPDQAGQGEQVSEDPSPPAQKPARPHPPVVPDDDDAHGLALQVARQVAMPAGNKNGDIPAPATQECRFFGDDPFRASEAAIVSNDRDPSGSSFSAGSHG